MSRADWSFLEHMLEEGQVYSTWGGRVWLTVLFLFRMLVLGTAAESAWDDEQSDFVCNTRQPGCTAVCYDKAFPISHFRYFVLQVIFVSTPTIFYFGYVAMMVAKKEEKKTKVGGDGERGQGREIKKEQKREVKHGDVIEELEEEKGGKAQTVVKARPDAPKLKGRLLCAYAASIVLKVLLEGGFIVGLWYLYGPTEKTIFTIYMQAVAGVSLLLNLMELLYLIQLAVTHRLEKHYAQKQYIFTGVAGARPRSGPQHQEMEMVLAPSYQEKDHLYLPIGEGCYVKPGESYVDVGSGAGMDPTGELPSYLNCMKAMRTTHSQGKAQPRKAQPKNISTKHKHIKGAPNRHSNQNTKHYF
ncbi:hypothetical protein UPYG_G00331030 [Umbra pygmaea]|uniref:Uncharacterized protein n=1 Tax=Umbra pygmaea TaxID=75934 RepID=A0ABD0VVI3_UMBPY